MSVWGKDCVKKVIFMLVGKSILKGSVLHMYLIGFPAEGKKV